MNKSLSPSAGLIIRFAAMVYDSLLALSIAMVYGALFLAIKHLVFQIELGPGERATIGSSGFVGLFLIVESFFWFFWCRGGQTLGMRTWRLKLISKDGGAVTLPQAIVRGLLAPISFATFGLGYFWCLWDRKGETWHDKLSNTQVIRLTKPTK